MNPWLTAFFALATVAASGLLFAQTPPPSATPNSLESVAEEPTPPASDYTHSPNTDTQAVKQANTPNAADALKLCMARQREQNSSLTDQQLKRACTGSSSSPK
jgi:hypothetical protein